VLPGDTATAIAKDCSDFVTAEDWYADRGIPYRRGYLLHGMYCNLGILAV
jgi:chaperone BCS1